MFGSKKSEENTEDKPEEVKTKAADTEMASRHLSGLSDILARKEKEGSKPSGIPAQPQPNPLQNVKREQNRMTQGEQPKTRENGAVSSNTHSFTRKERRELVVSHEITLSGEISACDHLVIEGTVDAKLKDAQSIAIAEGGQFRGKITIQSAVISGLFEGELDVEGQLTITASGTVRGRIHCGELEVERGGKLIGEISVGTEARTEATKPNKKAKDPAQMSLTA